MARMILWLCFLAVLQHSDCTIQVNFDTDDMPISCKRTIDLNDEKARLNSMGRMNRSEEGRVGRHKTFTCPVTLTPGTNKKCDDHRIMCVRVLDSFNKLWSQCFVGLKLSWYRDGKLFAERIISCHMPNRRFLEEDNWCSEVTNGKLRIELFEYQERRRVPYHIISEVTQRCSREAGLSFGLPVKVSYVKAYVIDVHKGEPLSYGLITGILLALFWLFVLLVTYIYYKLNPPEKH